MTRTISRCLPTQSVARFLLIACGSAVVLGAAGCERDDSVEQALAKGRRLVSSATAERDDNLSNDAARASEAKGRQGKLAELKAALSPASGEGATAAEKAAANVLLSAGHQDLGDAKRAIVVAETGAALVAIEAARNSLLEWNSVKAREAAARAFDPTKALARHNEALTKAGQDKQAAEANVRRLQGETSALRGQGGRLQADAAAARETIANTLTAAENKSEVEKLAVQREVAAMRAEAARAESEAFRILTRVRELERDTETAALEVQRAERSAALASGSIADLNRQKNDAAKAAEELAKQAAGIAEQLKTQVAELAKFRGASPEAPTEASASAETAYREALKSAGNAGSGGASKVVKLAKGNAALGAASVLLNRARVQGAQADLLEAIGATQPAVPGVDVSAAGALKGAAAKSLEDGRELIKSARGDIEAGGTEKMAAALAALDEVASGKSQLQAVPAAAPTPESPTPAASGANAAATTGDEAAIKVVIGEAIAKSKAKDFAGATGLVHFPTPELSKAFVEVVRATGEASFELDQACIAKFGKTTAEIAAESAGDGAAGMGSMSSIDVTRLAMSDPSSAQVTVTGDTAIVMLKDKATPVTMIKVNGKWMIDSGMPAEVAGMMGPMLSQLKLAAPAMNAAIKKVTEAVKAGEISKAADVPVKVQQEIMQAMMGGMGGPGKKGGGGGG